MCNETLRTTSETSPVESTDTAVRTELTREDPSRREWLAHVRHELRTPLNAILGYSEMLLEDARDSDNPALDRVAGDLVEVNESGRLLLQIINDSLDAARLHSVRDDQLPSLGALVREQVRAPLAMVLDGTARTHAVLLRHPESAEQILPEVEKIRTAAERLQGLLQDLTHFAQGDLHAAAGGAAVPPVLPPTAPFVAANGETDPELVRETLRSLPGPAKPANGGHILVVDDNIENRDILVQRLTREGHRVTTAADGIEALDRLRHESFDLVLLDVMMPRLNGVQVLQQMKADATWRHLPVVMISALDEENSIAGCLEAGADDYLAKPFDPAILRARVTACLERKRLRDGEVALREQLEENYQRLREAESLRDSLTDMVVHDLRTPLTSFMGGLRLIPALGEINPMQKQTLDIAVRGGETLLGMINDLLDVSKTEAGALKLNTDELDTADLIQSALDNVSDLVRAENQTLIPEIEVIHFQGDAEKLRRTLVNLLGNAAKFTPRGGIITVRAAMKGGFIQFEIEDTGPGIPAEMFDTIFEKFGQADTRSRSHGQKFSTGLGLTFCKLVVEAHGGRIWVESVVGQGSNFLFTVPV